MARFSNPQNFKGQGLISKQDLGLSAETDVLVSGSKIVSEYMPTLKFQGNEVGNFANSINIIGIGNVTVDESGNITLRLGENLNCSEFNKTDGISDASITTTATGADSLTIAKTLFAGSYNSVFRGTDDYITAKSGTTKTTATVAGDSVHFNNTSDKISVNLILNGGAVTNISMQIPTITGSATSGAVTLSGVTCTLTNWQQEPNKAKGATGYCANIAIKIVPSSILTAAGTIKIDSINVIDGVSNAVIGGTVTHDKVYYWLTDDTVPGKPTSASYTISAKEKTISGVRYLTTASTITPTASNITNVGYPAMYSTKVKVSPKGSTWFNAKSETETSVLTTWTTVSGTAMTFTGNTIGILRGTWVDPELSVTAYNNNADGVGSAESDTSATDFGTLYVCDANGYINDSNGTFTDSSRLNSAFTGAYTSTDLSVSGNTDLQTWNGCIIYPATNYSTYNTKVGTTANANPDYSECTGTRYAYFKFEKPDTTIAKGTISFGTVDEMTQAILDGGTFKIELAGDSNVWMNLNSIKKVPTLGTSSTIFFEIPQPANYGDGLLKCRVSMTKGCTVQLKSISLS